MAKRTTSDNDTNSEMCSNLELAPDGSRTEEMIENGQECKRLKQELVTESPQEENTPEQPSSSETLLQSPNTCTSNASTQPEQRPRQPVQWHDMRSCLDDVFLETRTPSKTACIACGDSEGDAVRCLDCGPAIMRCIDCTLDYHRDCHLLHKPELVLETSVRPFPLRSRFVRKNHQCETLHTKAIQVFDEKGRTHDCWFMCCSCEAESATLLRFRLWPATPDRPRVAFHMDLLGLLESLIAELSLKLSCEAACRRNSLEPQEADALYSRLANGSFGEYQLFMARNGYLRCGSTHNTNGTADSLMVHRETQGSSSMRSLAMPNYSVIFPGFERTPVRNNVGVEIATSDEIIDESCLDADGDLDTEYVSMQASGSYVPVYGVANHDQQRSGPVVASSAADYSSVNFGPREIVVMSTANEGKTRVWDKRYHCIFCREAYCKLPRHLESAHKDEPDVILLMNAACPERRRQILCKLRNLGNHVHNCDVLRRGEGTLIVAKRPSGNEPRSANDYRPCPHCFGYFVGVDTQKHQCIVKDLGPELSAVWLNVTLQC